MARGTVGACDCPARAWLVIGHVVLTEEETALRVSVDPAPPGARPGRGSPPPGPPRTLEISDDQGTTSSAHFEGSRGAASRHGAVPSARGRRWLLTRRGSASWASGLTSPASLRHPVMGRAARDG